MSTGPKLIVVATRNPGKLKEILAIMTGLGIEWRTLADYPECPEAVESGTTFEENARIKAKVASESTGEWALADDSGLAVDALGGAPGVYSARYAGAGADDRLNNEKLLRELRAAGQADSPAAFHCAMVLRSPEGREWSSHGAWPGRITESPRGANGFGYDPLFFLPELNCTSAELNPEEKNSRSHRAQALRQIRDILIDFPSA